MTQDRPKPDWPGNRETPAPDSGGKIIPLSGKSFRILTVDDVAEIAQALAELLELWGHQTRTALDGPAALKTARAWHPEVILLNIGMPGMDGYQVARRLRLEHGKEVLALVALTGYGQEIDRAWAKEAGFDAYLVKPVSAAILYELLTQIRK